MTENYPVTEIRGKPTFERCISRNTASNDTNLVSLESSGRALSNDTKLITFEVILCEMLRSNVVAWLALSSGTGVLGYNWFDAAVS